MNLDDLKTKSETVTSSPDTITTTSQIQPMTNPGLKKVEIRAISGACLFKAEFENCSPQAARDYLKILDPETQFESEFHRAGGKWGNKQIETAPCATLTLGNTKSGKISVEAIFQNGDTNTAKSFPDTKEKALELFALVPELKEKVNPFFAGEKKSQVIIFDGNFKVNAKYTKGKEAGEYWLEGFETATTEAK